MRKVDGSMSRMASITTLCQTSVAASGKEPIVSTNHQSASFCFYGYFFFSKWVSASHYIVEMHTACFISFIQQNWPEALQRSYKPKPPIKGVKAPPN
jgi:hypothetical protein